MYTVESVKEQLPKIKIELGDKTVVEGVLSGRLNKFATISVYMHKTWFTLAECNWQTIVNCLNSGKAIKA